MTGNVGCLNINGTDILNNGPSLFKKLSLLAEYLPKEGTIQKKDYS
jgi:hypothetical protein